MWVIPFQMLGRTVLALWAVSLSKPRWGQERVPWQESPLMLTWFPLFWSLPSSASCLQEKQALIRLLQTSCPLNNYISNWKLIDEHPCWELYVRIFQCADRIHVSKPWSLKKWMVEGWPRSGSPVVSPWPTGGFPQPHLLTVHMPRHSISRILDSGSHLFVSPGFSPRPSCPE